MRRLPRRAAAGALLLLLPSACGLFGQEQESRACPEAVILADAKRITLYRSGPGRDLTDVEFEGEIARISGGCAYGRRDLTVTLAADIVAARGPAAGGPEATLPFFVAVLDEKREVLAKQVFESVIPIPSGRRRAGVREEIEQVIPLTDAAPFYEIVVGFQLTPEQLEQNRRARAG